MYEQLESSCGISSFSAALPKSVQAAALVYDISSFVPFHLEYNISDGSHFVKDLMKKELLQSLSKEAVEVLELVFDSPREIISAYGRPSKDLIKKELRKRGWKHKIIDLVFDEIKLFVKEIC